MNWWRRKRLRFPNGIPRAAVDPLPPPVDDIAELEALASAVELLVRAQLTTFDELRKFAEFLDRIERQLREDAP